MTATSDTVKDYLYSKEIPHMFECLIGALMHHQPSKPITFVRDCLVEIKSKGGADKISWNTFIDRTPEPVPDNILHDLKTNWKPIANQRPALAMVPRPPAPRDIVRPVICLIGPDRHFVDEVSKLLKAEYNLASKNMANEPMYNDMTESTKVASDWLTLVNKQMCQGFLLVNYPSTRSHLEAALRKKIIAPDLLYIVHVLNKDSTSPTLRTCIERAKSSSKKLKVLEVSTASPSESCRQIVEGIMGNFLIHPGDHYKEEAFDGDGNGSVDGARVISNAKLDIKTNRKPDLKPQVPLILMYVGPESKDYVRRISMIPNVQCFAQTHGDTDENVRQQLIAALVMADINSAVVSVNYPKDEAQLEWVLNRVGGISSAGLIDFSEQQMLNRLDAISESLKRATVNSYKNETIPTVHWIDKNGKLKLICHIERPSDEERAFRKVEEFVERQLQNKGQADNSDNMATAQEAASAQINTDGDEQSKPEADKESSKVAQVEEEAPVVATNAFVVNEEPVTEKAQEKEPEISQETAYVTGDTDNPNPLYTAELDSTPAENEFADKVVEESIIEAQLDSVSLDESAKESEGKTSTGEEDNSAKPDVPVVEEKVAEPVVEEKVAEPVVEEKVEEPVIEEKVAEPVVEEKVEEPVVEEKVAEPVIEEKVEEPVVEEKVVEPVVEEKVEEPVVEEKVTEPVVEEKAAEPVVEEVVVSASEAEEKVAETIVNETIVDAHSIPGTGYGDNPNPLYSAELDKAALQDSKIVFFNATPGFDRKVTAAKLAEILGFIHLSTHELLKAEASSETERGQNVKQALSSGDLVDVEIVFEVVQASMIEKLQATSEVIGFLVDGYPAQAEQEAKFEDSIKRPDAVVVFDSEVVVKSDDDSQRKRIERFEQGRKSVYDHLSQHSSTSIWHEIKVGAVDTDDVALQQAASILKPQLLNESTNKPADNVVVSDDADDKLKNTKIIFVLGGPGSGKGTQCDKIKERYKLGHFSSGDLLRAEVASGSERGKKLEAAMAAGELVTLDTVLELLRDAVTAAVEKGSAPGFLLDGFPRELEQAVRFEKEISSPEVVLFFDVSEETMRGRLLKRGETSGRVDDNEETIIKRFKTFSEHSKPVVEHYKPTGKLKAFKAEGTPDAIFKEVCAALDPVFGKK